MFVETNVIVFWGHHSFCCWGHSATPNSSGFSGAETTWSKCSSPPQPILRIRRSLRAALFSSLNLHPPTPWLPRASRSPTSCECTLVGQTLDSARSQPHGHPAAQQTCASPSAPLASSFSGPSSLFATPLCSPRRPSRSPKILRTPGNE